LKQQFENVLNEFQNQSTFYYEEVLPLQRQLTVDFEIFFQSLQNQGISLQLPLPQTLEVISVENVVQLVSIFKKCLHQTLECIK
jgi:hypothetical protein